MTKRCQGCPVLAAQHQRGGSALGRLPAGCCGCAADTQSDGHLSKAWQYDQDGYSRAALLFACGGPLNAASAEPAQPGLPEQDRQQRLQQAGQWHAALHRTGTGLPAPDHTPIRVQRPALIAMEHPQLTYVLPFNSQSERECRMLASLCGVTPYQASTWCSANAGAYQSGACVWSVVTNGLANSRLLLRGAGGHMDMVSSAQPLACKKPMQLTSGGLAELVIMLAPSSSSMPLCTAGQAGQAVATRCIEFSMGCWRMQATIALQASLLASWCMPSSALCAPMLNGPHALCKQSWCCMLRCDDTSLPWRP